MRRVLVGVLMLGAASAAQAADMPFDIPTLRGSDGPEIGPPTYYRWDGFYFGAQAGYNSASLNFFRAIADLQRNMTLEQREVPELSTSGNSFGAFVGYNMQWDDAVVGFELNYDNSNLRGAVTDTFHTFNGVTMTSTASLRLHDYVTARVRGGWSAGWIMPYIFGAVAVARLDVASAVTLDGPQFNGPRTVQDTRDNAFAYGYAAGLGVDMMLIGGLFVRAEWEYLKLIYDVGYEASVNTIRGGLGWKF